MSDTPDLQVHIDRIFLRRLAQGLRAGQIHKPQVPYLARAMIALRPLSSYPEALAKLQILVSTFPYFVPVFERMQLDYAESQTQSKVDEMRKHLQSGDIDSALSVVHQV